VRCEFLTKDSICTGRYSGYSCIKKQCTYLKETQKCEFHENTGDYCRKYGRFGCVGKNSCRTLTDYLEAVSVDVRA
jgi:hypothetical protein